MASSAAKRSVHHLPPPEPSGPIVPESRRVSGAPPTSGGTADARPCRATSGLRCQIVRTPPSVHGHGHTVEVSEQQMVRIQARTCRGALSRSDLEPWNVPSYGSLILSFPPPRCRSVTPWRSSPLSVAAPVSRKSARHHGFGVPLETGPHAADLTTAGHRQEHVTARPAGVAC